MTPSDLISREETHTRAETGLAEFNHKNLGSHRDMMFPQMKSYTRQK